MMEDADDPDSFSPDIIENAVAAVRQAPYRRLDFRPERPRVRVAAKKVKRLVEALEIGSRHVRTELADAVFENVRQVGIGSRAEADLSQAVPR